MIIKGVINYRQFAAFFFHHWDPQASSSALAKKKMKSRAAVARFIEPVDPLVAAALKLLRERILIHTRYVLN